MTGLLEFVAHLDWFERLDELLKWSIGVRSWRVAIVRECGWSGREIERMLKMHGINVWGRNFSRSNLYFRVKTRQARWTYYLLRQHGIPVHNSPPY